MGENKRGNDGTPSSYRALYESSPDPLLTVDAAGVVLSCNRTAVDFLGSERGDVLGRALSDWVQEDDHQALERTVAEGGAGVSERRFHLRDGRTVSLNIRRVGQGSGAVHITMRDMTTRLVLQQAHDQRRQLAALAELAGSIARELNDPMSIVQGRIELLLETGELDAASVRRHLEIVLEHARRVSATLHNLRLVGQRPSPQLDRVELSRALESALELVGPRRHRLPIELDLEDDELAIGGRAADSARVFANLISHMLDITGASTPVLLRARREHDGVCVQLHGGPWPQGAVFDEPLDAPGFGLAIARTLVMGTGGVLDVRRTASSQLVSVLLPFPPGRRARAKPVEDCVLVVGAAGLHDATHAILHREGFVVRSVSSAEEALSALDDDGSIHWVATDLVLPGLSGLSLCDEIGRRHSRLMGRVVLVTNAKVDVLPPRVQLLNLPLRRESLLTALGRRVRRRTT